MRWKKPRLSLSINRQQKKKRLLLSEKKRERMLLRIGYSEREISEMVRKINKCRNQRRNTVTHLGNQKMEEVVESARRIVSLSVFQKKQQKNEEPSKNVAPAAPFSQIFLPSPTKTKERYAC